MNASGPATADAAAGELLRRESEHPLGETVWQDLTAAALRVQGDPAAAWGSTFWPDVVSVALNRGLLTQARRGRYTRTALGMNPAGPNTRPTSPDTYRRIARRAATP